MAILYLLHMRPMKGHQCSLTRAFAGSYPQSKNGQATG